MKAICGINRIIIQPENDADRALLHLYNTREGQKITVEFNEWGYIEGPKAIELIELYINFEMITETEK